MEGGGLPAGAGGLTEGGWLTRDGGLWRDGGITRDGGLTDNDGLAEWAAFRSAGGLPFPPWDAATTTAAAAAARNETAIVWRDRDIRMPFRESGFPYASR